MAPVYTNEDVDKFKVKPGTIPASKSDKMYQALPPSSPRMVYSPVDKAIDAIPAIPEIRKNVGEFFSSRIGPNAGQGGITREKGTGLESYPAQNKPWGIAYGNPTTNVINPHAGAIALPMQPVNPHDRSIALPMQPVLPREVRPVAAPGSIRYNLDGGDPNTLYDPENGATLPAADRGRFASGARYDAARKAYNEFPGKFGPDSGNRFQTLPDGSKQILPPRASNDLMSASGRGGGQVMQATTTDPETLKLIAERRAAVLPAQESYNRTLDEANIMEGAHGSRAGNRAQLQIAALRDQQMKAFAEKHGVDLRSMEFQATLPKIQADIDMLHAQARNYDAQAQSVPFRAKSLQGQTLHDMIIQNNKAIATPDITLSPEESAARADTLRKQNAVYWEELQSIEGKHEAKPQAKQNVPPRDQFIARAKQANPGYTDDEIAAEYDKKYGGRPVT